MKVDGFVAVESLDGFADTLWRLDALLAERGIKPMARIDHSGAAAAAGLTLRPLMLILFGDPRIGTGLMQESPSAGIDLPLKLLVWEEADGRAWVGYNDPAWIEERHGLRQAKMAYVRMASILIQLARAAAGSDQP